MLDKELDAWRNRSLREFPRLILDATFHKISMDGKGRAFDNIMIERLWRTVKYEDVYLNDYEDFYKAYQYLEKYFDFYNNERRHSSLGKKTPSEFYHRNRKDQKVPA